MDFASMVEFISLQGKDMVGEDMTVWSGLQPVSIWMWYV